MTSLWLLVLELSEKLSTPALMCLLLLRKAYQERHHGNKTRRHDDHEGCICKRSSRIGMCTKALVFPNHLNLHRCCAPPKNGSLQTHAIFQRQLEKNHTPRCWFTRTSKHHTSLLMCWNAPQRQHEQELDHGTCKVLVPSKVCSLLPPPETRHQTLLSELLSSGLTPNMFLEGVHFLITSWSRRKHGRCHIGSWPYPFQSGGPKCIDTVYAGIDERGSVATCPHRRV